MDLLKLYLETLQAFSWKRLPQFSRKGLPDFTRLLVQVKRA